MVIRLHTAVATAAAATAVAATEAAQGAAAADVFVADRESFSRLDCEAEGRLRLHVQ